MFIGKRNSIENGFKVAEAFHDLAKSNFDSAVLLQNNGLYNESAYFYIQAMEKYVKEQICNKIDVSNPYFAEKLRNTGHSLDISINFLIEIYGANNEILKQQLEDIFLRSILKNTVFSKLNSILRYPSYNYHKEEYAIISVSFRECEQLKQMTLNLKSALDSLYKL